jgi:hypothetical protein
MRSARWPVLTSGGANRTGEAGRTRGVQKHTIATSVAQVRPFGRSRKRHTMEADVNGVFVRACSISGAPFDIRRSGIRH